MTLLVIKLKLPEAGTSRRRRIWPKPCSLSFPRVAWLISFFVLALFWIANHRVFSHIRRADAKLLLLTPFQLAFVSLMPFSYALIGERGVLLSQMVYSFNMAMLGVTNFWIARNVHRHPALGLTPMPQATYRGARFPIAGLIMISIVVVAWPGPCRGWAPPDLAAHRAARARHGGRGDSRAQSWKARAEALTHASRRSRSASIQATASTKRSW